MQSTVNTQIADGIYWVGVIDEISGFKSNPYLLIDKGEAVLFDPGSVLDFEAVLENVKKLIPLRKIKYVVLHHQDPDLCASVPMFEKENMNFQIVTHWRTSRLLKYYGIKSEYYLVDEHDYSLELKSGKILTFIPTPYLHFPGAIATYDKTTKVLFSGDLFGAVTEGWSLYEDENYVEGMVAFHEHYMPSNAILRPVMEIFEMMDIYKIASQHGCVIKDNVYEYIEILKNLECGIFLDPVKKNLKEAGGYSHICSLVLKRLLLLYSEDELREIIKGLDVKIDKNCRITDYNYDGPELWEMLFETIYKNAGIKSLIMLEPPVTKISKEYGIPMPTIYRSQLNKVAQESMILREEMIELKEQNERLNQDIEQTHGRLSRCPITGLYNETFFKQFLETEIQSKHSMNPTNKLSLILLSVDDISRINMLYGTNEYNNTLKTFAYILTQNSKSNHVLFRLDGSKFAYTAPDLSKGETIKIAENLRNTISQSKMFIEQITASLSVCTLTEIRAVEKKQEHLTKQFLEAGILRLRLAKGQGGDFVCSESDLMDLVYEKGKILIVDSDVTNASILKSYLNNRDYNVIEAHNGEDAASLAQSELPNLIISEIMLPKMDGFLLREKLSLNSSTKKIPFIVVSNLKNEDSVRRALSLGIDQFFQKPYMLTELLGIVDLKLKE